MTTGRSLLLRNGTVLLHQPDNHVRAEKTDILIQGNKIRRIERLIRADHETEIIDCTEKIISPGFIDTHHHVWQTQLRGLHANDTLLNYLPKENIIAASYLPEDVFWGQLGGCLEMIGGGTTTVVDYAMVNYSLEHNEMAISATSSSGIRSVFCYCSNPRLESRRPFKFEDDTLGAHALDTLDHLAARGQLSDGRITLGLAFDGIPFSDQAALDVLRGKLDQYQIRLITAHYCRVPVLGSMSIPRAMAERGWLDERVLIAHSSNMTHEDLQLYRENGVHFSTTPSTELQMGLGSPGAAFDPSFPGAAELASLGVDCHSVTSSYIPFEAKLALQSSRAVYQQRFLNEDKQARKVGPSVEEAFNQATIRGAYAAKMGDLVGSVEEGKLADLVIFNATSLALVCAAYRDPVAAIILHSSPADIDTVIVDGIVRKHNGKLLAADLDGYAKKAFGRDGSLTWSDVSKELIKSRDRLEEKIEGFDHDQGERGILDAFGVDASQVVDSL